MFGQTEHQVQRPWGRRKLGWLQGHPGGGGSEGSCRKGKPVGAAPATGGTLACSEQEGLCRALGSGMTQGGNHNSLEEQWLRVEVVRNGQTRDIWEGRAQDLLMLNVGFGTKRGAKDDAGVWSELLEGCSCHFLRLGDWGWGPQGWGLLGVSGIIGIESSETG